MRTSFLLLLAMTVGMFLGRLFDAVPTTAEAAGGRGGTTEECVALNGDVNADDTRNVTDAIILLRSLFLGEPPELLPLCEPQAPAGLPDTGLATCRDQQGALIDCTSDTCAGQDGFYLTGCPSEGRFVDNGDGTVTDTCTGLMWEKSSGNDGNRLDWCEALAYCEELELGGHDDWRLPNIRELESVVDYTRVGPAIDPVFDSWSGFYWSSTSSAASPDLAWFVHFIVGSTTYVDKSLPYQVRAVRSGT